MTKASSDVRQSLHRRQGVRHRAEGCMAHEVVTAVSQTIPSGHRAAPRHMYSFHPHGALVLVVQVHNLLSEILKTEKLRKPKVFFHGGRLHTKARVWAKDASTRHTQSTPRRCVASGRSLLGLELHPAGCVSRVSALLRQSVSKV
jgi:hypothetical protein